MDARRRAEHHRRQQCLGQCRRQALEQLVARQLAEHPGPHPAGRAGDRVRRPDHHHGVGAGRPRGVGRPPVDRPSGLHAAPECSAGGDRRGCPHRPGGLDGVRRGRHRARPAVRQPGAAHLKPRVERVSRPVLRGSARCHRSRHLRRDVGPRHRARCGRHGAALGPACGHRRRRAAPRGAADRPPGASRCRWVFRPGPTSPSTSWASAPTSRT